MDYGGYSIRAEYFVTYSSKMALSICCDSFEHHSVVCGTFNCVSRHFEFDYISVKTALK